MRTIHKYYLTIGDHMVSLPIGCELLSVQCQRGDVVLWALVDPAADMADVRIMVIGTGWQFEDSVLDGMRHFETAQSVALVWHVFVPAESLAGASDAR